MSAVAQTTPVGSQPLRLVRVPCPHCGGNDMRPTVGGKDYLYRVAGKMASLRGVTEGKP